MKSPIADRLLANDHVSSDGHAQVAELESELSGALWHLDRLLDSYFASQKEGLLDEMLKAQRFLRRSEQCSRDAELKKACEIVESRCRSVGRDCQVIFSNAGVEIAPLSWAGSETACDFFTALKQAARHSDDN